MSTTTQIHITKKVFKERCSFHEYGTGKKKHNAIYYDWCENKEGKGFKYGIASSIQDCTKNELFDCLYDWVCNEISLPYYVRYKYATDDKHRFKVSLILNF